MWPYMIFSNFNTQVSIFCAFDAQIVKMVKIPKKTDNYIIKRTFVTEDFDLFIVTECYDLKAYELWEIDLDAPRGFINF
jgi:predicted RNA-binding protein with PIN domain